MAQVLAPIQPSGSMTMLHTPQDVFVAGSAGQSHHSPSRSSQIPRNHIYSQIGTVGYRGASSAPVTPYAFQSTPNLRLDLNKGLPSEPSTQHTAGTRLRPSASAAPASASFTAASSSSSLSNGYFTKDDSIIGPTGRRHSDFSERPASSVDVPSSTQGLVSAPEGQVKTGPERYRRRRSENNLQLSKARQVSRSVSPAGSADKAMDGVGRAPAYMHRRMNSADDDQSGHVNKVEVAKRYRRRTAGSIDSIGHAATDAAPVHEAKPAASAIGSLPKADAGPARIPTSQATFAGHRRNASGESNSSRTGQRPSSVSSAISPISFQGNANMNSLKSRRSSGTATPPGSPSLMHEPRKIAVPPRGSSDANKRISSPSPLSRPINVEAHDAPIADRVNQAPILPQPSPAVQQLAALSDRNGAAKGVKSRLRRALSFSSSAELRRASAQNNLTNRSRQEPEEPLDPEQQAIAAQQEAAGFGSGIYSGQGVFTSSTDNLSISSTASSASIMLRKMGKSMKKSSRSLKGLFRPKSVVGVPAADSDGVLPVTGEVSVVNVEAERERARVALPARYNTSNAALSVPSSVQHDRPQTPVGGSSVDSSRKSIVGGEVERAEVLAAVKKGILKRKFSLAVFIVKGLSAVTDSAIDKGSSSASSSPVVHPVDSNSTDLSLPQIPNVASSTRSSSPNTPDNGSKIGIADDYFMAIPRLAGSNPATPQGGLRNISFSPRIQFYDAWSSVEYDRRGDIATCNRLTPMLAQQIKEELNTFKMVSWRKGLPFVLTMTLLC